MLTRHILHETLAGKLAFLKSKKKMVRVGLIEKFPRMGEKESLDRYG